jgi:hypothetical protein
MRRLHRGVAWSPPVPNSPFSSLHPDRPLRLPPRRLTLLLTATYQTLRASHLSTSTPPPRTLHESRLPTSFPLSRSRLLLAPAPRLPRPSPLPKLFQTARSGPSRISIRPLPMFPGSLSSAPVARQRKTPLLLPLPSLRSLLCRRRGR